MSLFEDYPALVFIYTVLQVDNHKLDQKTLMTFGILRKFYLVHL